MEIIKHPHKFVMTDALEGCDSWEIKIGEHGTCSLIDMLPRLVPKGRTADTMIVRAARTSTGQELKSPVEDRNLVRYMYSHAHSSPLEQVVFTFHMVLPIFVARQLIRHRTARVNEYSLRYAPAKDRFWFPESTDIRKQGVVNKQGGDEAMSLEAAQQFVENLHQSTDRSWPNYQQDLANGVSRELARTQLPVNIHTEWVWQIDLSNLLKTLALRQDHHAQAEIRVYGDAMYALVKPLVPDAVEAYDDYNPNRGGMTLSRMEIDLMAKLGDTAKLGEFVNSVTSGMMTKREINEFLDKLVRLSWAATEQINEIKEHIK